MFDGIQGEHSHLTTISRIFRIDSMLMRSTILFVGLSFVVILSTKRYGTLASKSIGPPDGSRHCSKQDDQPYCHRTGVGTSNMHLCRDLLDNIVLLFKSNMDKDWIAGIMLSFNENFYLVHALSLQAATILDSGFKLYHPAQRELSMDHFVDYLRPQEFRVVERLVDINLIKLDMALYGWDGSSIPLASVSMNRNCFLYSYSKNPVDVVNQKSNHRWFVGHSVDISNPNCDDDQCEFKFNGKGEICSGMADLGAPILCNGLLAYVVITPPEHGCKENFTARNLAKYYDKIVAHL